MTPPAPEPAPSVVRLPSGLGGYVLAGGRSSRMGTNKALLPLAGKPLIAHAVTKLRRLCRDVHILSGAGTDPDDSRPELSTYAPLVRDLHPNCGPIGGIEAALVHSPHAWTLILPVDLPFLPTAFLQHWAQGILTRRTPQIGVALFNVYGVPQPTLLLLHRDAAPFLTQAIARGEYKLLPALEAAALALAPPNPRIGDQLPYVLPVDENLQFPGWTAPRPGPLWQILTAAQRAAQPIWFANLNTPADYALAQANTDALDT